MRWLATLVLAVGCASPPETSDEVALLQEELGEAQRTIARLEDELAAQNVAREIEEDEVVLGLVEARKEARKEIARLRDEVAAQKAALERTADEELKRLRKEVRNLRFFLDEYSKRYGDIGSGKGTEGYVLRVDGSSVTISVGSSDGLQVGDVYHIRRGDSYVGQMTIAKVEKNRSHGVFDAQFPGPGAPPRRADVAYPGGR